MSPGTFPRSTSAFIDRRFSAPTPVFVPVFR
jgi:hypothetical protein